MFVNLSDYAVLDPLFKTVPDLIPNTREHPLWGGTRSWSSSLVELGYIGAELFYSTEVEYYRAGTNIAAYLSDNPPSAPWTYFVCRGQRKEGRSDWSGWEIRIFSKSLQDVVRMKLASG